MDRTPEKFPYLFLFILLSVSVHLLVLFLFPAYRGAPPGPRPEPIQVEMRELSQPRELEALRAPPTKPREDPARRLGPEDQVAEREKAPKGSDAEERAPSPAAPSTVEPAEATTPTKAQSEAPPEVKSPPEYRMPQAPSPSPSPAPRSLTRQELLPPLAPRPAPRLKDLLALAPSTLERELEGLRQKYRKDVEEGDALWLDMEKDLLHSFFQRFRNNIYNVWNYPLSAREREHEGTALLQVTVNRSGEVEEVKLMESSGWPELDREAIEAVYDGAPYGNLPRSFKRDNLTVFAFFQYRLRGRVIF